MPIMTMRLLRRRQVNPSKKKDGGSDSFIGKGSAQTADAGTNQDDYSDLTSGMEISDADLINKIKNKQDSQVDIAGMPRESTGVNMPMRSLPQMDIKADMDPKEDGIGALATAGGGL